MDASVYAEDMCNELVSISSSLENPGVILQGVDKMQRPFLDVLIECELKQVNKSHTYLQMYLGETSLSFTNIFV